MTLLLSIVVLAALAVCFAGIYALLFDPKFVDEEERQKVARKSDFNKQMSTNLT